MERAGPVWERAWALDEIRKGSQGWSLAADAGLLHFLKEFSQQTISRTHEIKKQVDGLIHETKATDCRLRNVFNDFLMLSNTQFIENRVYDDEVEEPLPKAEVGDKAEQEKTREQKEADLIPKIQEAVNYGLQVLDSAFEQLDIKAGNSDSEEEETNERVELILEPKDLYIDRPLPYLIGSQLFLERDDVGLGDFSSEGSVDSDRGSVIDSEEKDEEESDDEFGNPSEEDQKPVRRRTFGSDEEEEEDGCDLFGDSEKEEDEEENVEEKRPRKKRPTSFADELAARIKGDVPSNREEVQSSLSAEIKTKKTVKAKDVRVPSDDDEDDIFKPPKLTDEDFSPFGSKGGLFSGGMGLFDDDEEGDLFAEAPRRENVKDKELRVPINDEPPTKPSASRKVPAGAVSLFPGGNDVFSSASVLVEKENKKSLEQSAERAPKPPGNVSLFEDNDDFFVEPANQRSRSAKSAADLFDNEEGDFFEEEPDVPAAVSKAAEGRKESMGGNKSHSSSAEDFKPLSAVPKAQRGLFSDEEDSEDLFSPSQTLKSKSTSLPPSKSTPKAPLSLFDDEDEEDLFGTPAAKKQQSKPPQGKAKQSESLKTTSISLFSSDEEDHWNISKPTKPISEERQKGEPAPPGIAVDPSQAVKKTSLFEEDEEEEDLFAITKDSPRKHPKASLLFEEDAVNGGSLFSSQPTRLPSAAKATTEKAKPLQVPPSLFDEEAEKEDLLETSKTKVAEEKSGHTEKHKASPVTGGTEVAGQQEKEKPEPFAASPLGPVSHLGLFAASPPVEKEAKPRAKNVLSLFEEEEEEKMDNQDTRRVEQKEERKPDEKSAHLKSTGVFQDEELLFSRELQKDNDPDVDLFARAKKSGPAKLRGTMPAGGGLFGDDEDDDLFSIAKAKPPKVAEKKSVVKKTSSGSSTESSKDPENQLSAKQDEIPKAETSEANLAINPAALLPSAVAKISTPKPALPNSEPPLHEPHGLRSADAFAAAGSSQEAGVSFDCPMQADTLHSANKSRIKVTGTRRPPSRTARRLAAQESSENEEPQPTLPKQSSMFTDATEPEAKASTEDGLGVKLPSPVHGGSRLPGVDRNRSGRGAGHEDNLFGSDSLFVKNSASKPAAPAKTPESVAGRPPKGGETKPVLSFLEDQGPDEFFQPIPQKPPKKSSPVSLLEEDDLFTSQKTARRKELKSTPRQNLDPKAQDIFEDDIFATEAVKPLNRTREHALESNLFEDSIDIFADLTVKPKEKAAKKKVDPKSIFEDEMDDIFSARSPAKASTPKGRPSLAASEAKSESKASSTFDDPLNALGGQ